MPNPDGASLWRAIQDASDDALYTTDLESIVTSWNAAAEQLYGYSAAEAIGQAISIIQPPERAGEEAELVRRIQSGEEIRGVDTVRRRKDDRLIPVALTVSPIRNEAHEIVGTLRIARDVSGREGAERATRRLAAIVESSDDAIVSKDLNGIVTSWNESAEKLFGYTPDEIIGQSIRLLIPHDRQSEEDEVLARIRRGERVDHFETIRQRKDGVLVPISLTVSPIRDRNGTVIGASKIARDISYRKEIEAERARLLRVAEETAAITEKLNEVGSTVAAALDRATIVQAVVDAGTQGTGAEFGAFLAAAPGSHSADRFTFHTVSGFPKERAATLSESRAIEIFASTFSDEGVVRLADVSCDPPSSGSPPLDNLLPDNQPVRSYLAVPVKSTGGDVIGGLFFGHSRAGRFTDLHERLVVGIAAWASVALENARLYVDVQEASRIKDDFLATLSHELRTPLNAILGYARMLRSGIVPADRRDKAVETIERNANALTQMVEDVLDVSRIVAGKMRLNIERVNLSTVVRHAVDAVLPAAEAKGIRINRTEQRDPGTLPGDPDRLQQIVWNLISNAVKFTPPGGRIDVRLECVDRQAHIVVADNGMGIARPFLPHIFERFRQADSGTTRERGGLGIGLGLARQLVEMHGGTISAESAGPGLGSTFRVVLPLTTSDRATGMFGEPIVAGRRIEAIPNLAGVSVLAVDDDPDALMLLKEVLEATRATVFVANSANEALESVAAARPDVIVADIAMPRMDGFELIARIRQSPDAATASIPAAALTAYARSEDRVKALRSGFQLHLSKPIDPGELMTAIAELARRAPTHQ